MKNKTLVKNNKYSNFVDRICDEKMYHALNIQRIVINSFVEFMSQNNVKQMMPLMLTTETDPLNHSVFEAKIKYYDNTLSLMKSMILHKQIILANPDIDSVFIISPNVRLEKKETSIRGRHLIEFTQVDFEFKNKDKEFVKNFMEDLYIYIFTAVVNECVEDLKYFNRKLNIPQKPFHTYDAKKLEEKYGSEYEDVLSKNSTELFWIENLDRWFYDKEDQSMKGSFLNFDIIYPEGFGEGSSGAVREVDYHKLIERMKTTECNPEDYKIYLDMVYQKKVPQTAGAGIGFERLIRYICGEKETELLCPFARNAGEEILL